MRRLCLVFVLSTTSAADVFGQGAYCTTPTCTTNPSCCVPPGQPESGPPPAQPESGAFAAPPRTGTAVGPTRSLGIEGFGLHMPAMTLRMPTLQMPGLVRYRREPRMLIDAAEAGFVDRTAREYGVPGGTPESGTPPPPPGQPESGPPSCTKPYAALVPVDVGPIGAAVPPQPQPPSPRAVRAVAHPDFGMNAPTQGQYMQDPTTGQIYQVVVQPAQVQLQPVAMPTMTLPAATVPAMQHVVYAGAQTNYAQYPQTAAPQAAVQPTFVQHAVAQQAAVPQPAVMPLPVAAPEAPSQQEAALLATLQTTQARAAHLESELRRLESVVDRLAQAQVQASAAAPVATTPVVASQPSPVPAVAAQPQNLPLHSISESVSLQPAAEVSTPASAVPFSRFFKR